MRFHTGTVTIFAPHYLPFLSLEMRVASDLCSYAHSAALGQDRVCICNVQQPEPFAFERKRENFCSKSLLPAVL